MLIALLKNEQHFFGFLFVCGFSAEMHLSVAIGGDAGILVLEDITDEEVEVKPFGEGKETTPRWTKLKVPQK